MKSRRAVSPIVATMLLILVAVAAALIVYVALTSWAQSASPPPDTIEDKLQIEAVKYSSGTLTVYVRNIGYADATVKAVVIEKYGGGLVKHFDVSYTISPGGYKKISVSVTLQSGAYIVKVYTERGNCYHIAFLV